MIDKQHKKELDTAKAALMDLRERGNDAIGGSWREFEREHFTPEEISDSDFRVSLISGIIQARREKGISQKKLEELSGVKQPIIARLEKGLTNPRLDTIRKLLIPLGKRLYIGDAPRV